VGFPVVLFSHSFTGVKEQNSALLQELASWGHVVVAVDHPHDAALVLYPDGRYVLGLSQIPPPRLKDLKEAW
jgi:dienelactone hydrolase